MNWKRVAAFAPVLFLTGVVAAAPFLLLARSMRSSGRPLPEWMGLFQSLIIPAALLLTFVVLGSLQRHRPVAHALYAAAGCWILFAACVPFLRGRPIALLFNSAATLAFLAVIGAVLGSGLVRLRELSPGARAAAGPPPPGDGNRGSLSTLAVGLGSGLAAGLAVWSWSLATGVSVRTITRDTVAVFSDTAPVWIGLLSNLGILLWAVAAGVFLSSASLVSRWNGRGAGFLFWSGLVTLLLTFDDLLLFHERVFPVAVGIPEKAVYAAYVAILGSWLLRYARNIAPTGWIVLLGAFACMGLSTTLDQVFVPSDVEALWEDSLKFAGIVLWLAYAVRTSASLLGAARTDRTATEPPPVARAAERTG